MSGSKRQTNVKSGSDFKMRKAKVGKKALQPANLTDTSYKAASLHVAGQSVSHVASDKSLVSARGRSLSELTSQLGHPAAAVRLSAMKGLGNVVNQESSFALRPHLSTLLPACARSCVDEDQDVRSVGLSVFGDLLRQQDDATIRPFSSLLVAYATSALHSLDSAMRVDGTRTARLLTSTHPNLIEPFIDKLLPPFVTLLADRKAAKHCEEILQALVSLLRITKDNADRHLSDPNTEGPDLTYLLGGRSQSTVIMDGRKQKHKVRLLGSVRDLQSLDQLFEVDEPIGRGPMTHADDSSSSAGTFRDLLAKLRDLLVETTEVDIEATGTPASTSPMNVQRMMSLVKAIRLLWKRSKEQRTRDQNATEAMERLAQHIVSLLLAFFPVTQDDVRVESASIDTLNAAICTAIMDIASLLAPTDYKNTEGTKLDWIRVLCSYLLPKLDRLAEDGSSSPSLDVFCRLLLLMESNKEFSSMRLHMLQKLQTVFFEVEDIELARSAAGRKVALGVADVVKQHQCRLDQLTSSSKEVLVRTIKLLPFYLTSWGASFSFESEAILSFLHDLASQTVNPAEDPILSAARQQMSALVADMKSKPKSRNVSVFELFSVPLQRSCLGLLAMLKSPSSETLKGLASICARSNGRAKGSVSLVIADEIVDSVHAIRLSLSMQQYLSFLVTSIGIPKASQKPKKKAESSESTQLDVTSVLSLDCGVRRVAVAFIRCGSFRAFKSLLPHFSHWLKTDSEPHHSDSFLRFRAALSILAMFSLEMKGLDDQSSIFNTAPDLLNILALSICESLSFISASEKNMENRGILVAPIIALLPAESLLLNAIFEEVANRSSTGRFRKSEQANMIQLLLDFVEDPRLTGVLKEADQSVSHVRTIEIGLDKGPIHQKTERLRAILELKTTTA